MIGAFLSPRAWAGYTRVLLPAGCALLYACTLARPAEPAGDLRVSDFAQTDATCSIAGPAQVARLNLADDPNQNPWKPSGTTFTYDFLSTDVPREEVRVRVAWDGEKPGAENVTLTRRSDPAGYCKLYSGRTRTHQTLNVIWNCSVDILEHYGLSGLGHTAKLGHTEYYLIPDAEREGTHIPRTPWIFHAGILPPQGYEAPAAFQVTTDGATGPALKLPCSGARRYIASLLWADEYVDVLEGEKVGAMSVLISTVAANRADGSISGRCWYHQLLILDEGTRRRMKTPASNGEPHSLTAADIDTIVGGSRLLTKTRMVPDSAVTQALNVGGVGWLAGIGLSVADAVATCKEAAIAVAILAGAPTLYTVPPVAIGGALAVAGCIGGISGTIQAPLELVDNRRAARAVGQQFDRYPDPQPNDELMLETIRVGNTSVLDHIIATLKTSDEKKGLENGDCLDPNDPGDQSDSALADLLRLAAH